MDQALANNRDLRVAAANIMIARAQFRGAACRAAAPSSTRTARCRASTWQWRIDDLLGPISRLPSWELDLFGRIQSLTDAAREKLFRQRSRGAGDAPRLALGHCRCLADLCRRQEACSRSPSRRRTARARARRAGRCAAQGRRRQPHRLFRWRQTILATAQSDLARQKTLVAQDVNLLALLVGRADRRRAAACGYRAGRRDDRRSAGPRRAARSCCAGPMCSRPNMTCVPPMPISARRARRSSPGSPLSGLIGLASGSAREPVRQCRPVRIAGHGRRELSDLPRRRRPRQSRCHRSPARRAAGDL